MEVGFHKMDSITKCIKDNCIQEKTQEVLYHMLCSYHMQSIHNALDTVYYPALFALSCDHFRYKERFSLFGISNKVTMGVTLK